MAIKGQKAMDIQQHRHNLYLSAAAVFLLLQLFCWSTVRAADPLDSWRQRATLSARGLAYGNGIFVAVGEAGAIATSADGATWTATASSNTNSLNAVAAGTGTFVAVGDSGTVLTSSDNGATWTAQVSGLAEHLRAIAFGNGRFVAAGDGGTVTTSPDGITWTAATRPVTASLYGVAFGNGVFAAVGEMGTMLTSADNGATWTERNGGLSSNLWEIAYGNGIFAALGDTGALVTSGDGGESWTIQSPGTDGYLYGIGYGNGLFMAVGTDSIYSANIILTSPGGVTWTPRAFALTPDPPLVAVVYGGNTFVVSGGGAIMQSDPMAAMHTLTVDRTGPGAVTSVPAGIDCGSTCLASFPAATSLTLTAAPLAGASFNGWTGAVCSGNQPTCTFTIDADKTVAAQFSPNSLPVGSVLINGGAAVTNSLLVNLTLSATETDPLTVTNMQFSNDNLSWSLPEPYGTARQWALTGADGEKRVYVKFENSLGAWSGAVSDTITLDTTPPSTTAQPAGGVFPGPQTVTLSADETATIHYTLENAFFFESGTYQTPLLITESMTLTFFAIDGMGNVSAYNTQIYQITAPLKGDVNLDLKVDLADALLSLRVLNGEAPVEVRTDYPQSQTDPNGDGKIGLQDVIYILQRISGLR